jgi:hypothetical protein
MDRSDTGLLSGQRGEQAPANRECEGYQVFAHGPNSVVELNGKVVAVLGLLLEKGADD